MKIELLKTIFNYQTPSLGQMPSMRILQSTSTITTPPEKKSLLTRIFNWLWKKLCCIKEKEEISDNNLKSSKDEKIITDPKPKPIVEKPEPEPYPGVEKDFKQAAAYYELVANQGNVSALTKLGNHYTTLPTSIPSSEVKKPEPEPEPFLGFEDRLSITKLDGLMELIGQASNDSSKFHAVDRTQQKLLGNSLTMINLKNLATNPNLSTEELEKWIQTYGKDLVNNVRFCFESLGYTWGEYFKGRENFTKKCDSPARYVFSQIDACLTPIFANEVIKKSKHPNLIYLRNIQEQVSKIAHPTTCAHLKTEKEQI